MEAEILKALRRTGQMTRLIVVLAAMALPAWAQKPAGLSPNIEWAQEDSVRKYRFLAKDAREKNHPADAIQYYTEYLNYQPNDPKAYFWIGEIFLGLDQLDAAHRAFAQAISVDSLHFNSNYRLVEIFLEESQPDSASGCLERMLRPEAEQRRKAADLYYIQRNIPPDQRHYGRLVGDQLAEQVLPLVEGLAGLYEERGDSTSAQKWRRRLLDDGANTDTTKGGGK